jgi:hypothetical protein
MRTREPTCLSIGLGAFLAIRYSYAAIVVRNVTPEAFNAIQDLPRIDRDRQRRMKISLSWLRFSHDHNTATTASSIPQPLLR